MNCVKSDSWLNKANAGKEWNTAGKAPKNAFKTGAEHAFYSLPAWNRGINNLPEKELIRRSEKYKGSGNPNFGKKHSAEAIAKIKENRMSNNPNGRHATPHSEESKAIIKEKARKQAEAGGMAAHTKVCCIGCRKETNIPGFKRAHQNCSA